ncbi:Copper transport outer membrane protein, MctB [Rhodococcoides kroppenstedtii]|uniref:Copper transport outer membrane protein, MctB n=1 Tax=Rhodococcoides kroppenstedtii TaxID=293050 RepID=A0A1I0UBH7_9NOCA|nr:copper transporter [Rhodococcus kroppenstedtii]SFA61385.1 Copper transport outer membrane protein, MctB [Rhodococcus kroppenstedtii]
MISLRQHTVSLIAVFLALAVGVVLGSGLLSGRVLSGLRDDRDDLQSQVDDLESTNNALGERLNAADGFDDAVATRVVAGALADRSVVVITTPDADPADVDGVSRLIGDAGGRISGRVGLTEAFVSAASGDDLRTRLTNVVPAGAQLRTGAVDQGSLAGDLLGTVLLLDPASAQPQSTPDELALALDTLRGGGFLTYDDGAVAPAQLAVIVTGAAQDPGADGNRGAIVARFAGSLDGRGAGVVLAGRPESATGSGPIAVVRSDSALAAGTSTVDDVDRVSGRITTVLALQEQLGGASGRYGTGPGATAVTVGAPAR